MEKITNKSSQTAILSIAICWMFYLFGCLSRVEPGVLVHDLIHDFSLNATQVGFIVSVMYWSYNGMQIPWGIILDKIGYKFVITACCFICSLGVLIFGIANNDIQLMIGRFLVGFASSAAFLSCGKVASELYGKNKYPLFMGIATCMGCLGSMLGSTASSYLAKWYGWRSATVGIAIFGIILGIIAFFGLKASKKTNTITDNKIEKQKVNVLEGLKKLATNYNVWLIGFYGAMSYLPVSSIADLWGTSFMEKRFNIPTEQAAILPSLIYIGFGVGSVVSAIFAEKWNSYKKPVVWFTLGLIGTMWLAIYSNSIGFISCLILFFMASFFAGADTLTFSMCYGLVSKEFAGIASGFNNMILMMGGLFFDPQLGKLLDTYRAGRVTENGLPFYDLTMYRQAFVWVIVAICLSLVAVFFIKDSSPNEEK